MYVCMHACMHVCMYVCMYVSWLFSSLLAFKHIIRKSLMLETCFKSFMYRRRVGTSRAGGCTPVGMLLRPSARVWSGARQSTML